MQHFSAAQELLVEATEKLLALRQFAEWRVQLPRRCPPILWFGNTATLKPKVITIGANPSRQEYLAESAEEAAKKIQLFGDDSQLKYLEPPRNRFYVLSSSQELEAIRTNAELQCDIIKGYDAYFQNNPYPWFGKNKVDSYNVEGFLRGLGATYFSDALTYQAIHIDLFPFATISDFNTISTLTQRDLFYNNWAKMLVNSILDALKPEIIVIFGRSNVTHYTQYITSTLDNTPWSRYLSASYCIRRDRERNIPVIGLSTNLGNPKGFTAKGLFSFGNAVKGYLSENSLRTAS